ncbi:MAG: hypothetical protein QM756_40675 [Polyangiaceae bacterium]
MATSSELLGSHPRIVQRALAIELGELLERVGHFIELQAPRYRAFRTPGRRSRRASANGYACRSSCRAS